jgi:hypothetical protein
MIDRIVSAHSLMSNASVYCKLSRSRSSWCSRRRVPSANCAAPGSAPAKRLGEEPTRNFREPSNSNFSPSHALSPTHPRLYEVCLLRHRVPFREPGGAIAAVRKDEGDTAPPLRQELKNPHVCTLRALSTLWHLEANHNFAPQIPQSPSRH